MAWTHSDYGPAYNEADYTAEREACDAAQSYAESIMREGGTTRARNYITKEEAAAPVYAACNNEMRSRVEMWELRHDKPERVFAYYRDCNPGVPLRSGHRIEVTNFMGARLGYGTILSTWTSNMGDRRASFRVMFDGTEYSGTLYGENGTYCRLRRLKGKN